MLTLAGGETQVRDERQAIKTFVEENDIVDACVWFYPSAHIIRLCVPPAALFGVVLSTIGPIAHRNGCHFLIFQSPVDKTKASICACTRTHTRPRAVVICFVSIAFYKNTQTYLYQNIVEHCMFDLYTRLA